MRDYVIEVARFTQTPIDMAAMLALAVLSVVARGKYEIECVSGYVEILLLYICIVALSGHRKSPVFKHMTWPLKDWEKRQYDEQLADFLENG